MANYRFFQETGIVGGAGTTCLYVDSYNGDDANAGTNALPKKTLQAAMDASPANGADFILAGYFQEGDFISVKNYISFIAEGNVIIDGSLNTGFPIGTFGGNLNATFHNGEDNIRNYGTLTFKNFTGNIYNGGYPIWYNCVFENCLNVLQLKQYKRIAYCTFKNSYLGGFTTHLQSITTEAGIIEHNNFIDSELHWRGQYGLSMVIRSNYFDSTSKVDGGFVAFGDVGVFDYNFFEGTLTGKLTEVTLSGGTYDNIEAYQLANPTKAVNDLPSTTTPLFNQVNSEDYTLQEASPLVGAGHDNLPIGVYNVAKALDTSDGGIWTFVGIDNSTPGEALLTGSPTGTITSTAGIQVAPKVRVIKALHLPDFESNVGLGEVIGANLASANTPYLMDVEIQYSEDDVTYNGTWLKVPVGTQPFHDTVNNVGNDDAAYVHSNDNKILAKYLQIRITLRDNETSI